MFCFSRNIGKLDEKAMKFVRFEHEEIHPEMVKPLPKENLLSRGVASPFRRTWPCRLKTQNELCSSDLRAALAHLVFGLSEGISRLTRWGRRWVGI